MAFPPGVDPVEFMMGESFQIMENEYEAKMRERRRNGNLSPGDEWAFFGDDFDMLCT